MAYNCVVPSIITIDPVDQCGAYADILVFSETVPRRNASYPDEIVQSLEKVNRRHRELGGSFTPTDLKLSISPPSIHQSLLTVRPRAGESLVYVVEVPRDLPARRPHP